MNLFFFKRSNLHLLILGFQIAMAAGASVAAGEIRPSSSVAKGAGGAGIGGVNAADINFLNPAMLFHTYGRYFYGAGSGSQVFAGISEASQDIIMPASLVYFQDSQYQHPSASGSDPGGGSNSALNSGFLVKDVSLALGDFLFNKVSLGVTAHQYVVIFDDMERKALSRTLFDAGALWAPSENLGFALVLYNIGFVDRELLLPEVARPKSRFALGFNFLLGEMIRLRGDVVSGDRNSLKGPTFRVGFEDYMKKWLIWRLGVEDDQSAGIRKSTLGFGFEGPRFNLNYAFQKEMASDTFEHHSIDLTIPF